MKPTTIKFPEDVREKINGARGRLSFSATVIMLAELGLEAQKREQADLARIRGGLTQINPDVFPVVENHAAS